MGFLREQKDIGELEEEKEMVGEQLEIEQKKALIAEAKKRYGNDWKKFLGDIHSGFDWDSLKFKMQ